MGADPKFKDFLNEVKFERFKKGMDSKPLSDRRLTLALTRVGNLKKVMVDSEMEEAK
jgi:hypothetical protein